MYTRKQRMLAVRAYWECGCEGRGFIPELCPTCRKPLKKLVMPGDEAKPVV